MQRKQRIKLHVENDDYFGALASFFGHCRQEINKSQKSFSRLSKMLKSTEEDFLILQEDYKISKRQPHPHKVPKVPKSKMIKHHILDKAV